MWEHRANEKDPFETIWNIWLWSKVLEVAPRKSKFNLLRYKTGLVVTKEYGCNFQRFILKYVQVKWSYILDVLSNSLAKEKRERTSQGTRRPCFLNVSGEELVEGTLCLSFHSHALPTTTWVKQNKNQLLEKNDHEPGYQVLIEAYDACTQLLCFSYRGLLTKVHRQAPVTGKSHFEKCSKGGEWIYQRPRHPRNPGI